MSIFCISVIYFFFSIDFSLDHNQTRSRWLKPLFKIGWTRAIEEDDIYEVTSGLRSERSTDDYAKLWDLELKKPNPNILNVIFRVHGCKSLAIGLLYAVFETLNK